jgi:hypothetical protein
MTAMDPLTIEPDGAGGWRCCLGDHSAIARTPAKALCDLVVALERAGWYVDQPRRPREAALPPRWDDREGPYVESLPSPTRRRLSGLVGRPDGMQ